MRYVSPAWRVDSGSRAREEDAEVGEVRERRPHLLPVHDEVAVVEPRARPHAGEVRACAGLGEALAPDLLGREERREVAPLLLLGAVRDDRRAGHADADDADVRRRLGARELLEEDRLVRVRRAAAAVLLGPGEPDVAGVVERPAPGAHLGSVEAGRPTAVALEVVREVLLEPRAKLGPERGLLGRVAQIHRARS